jgi:hypothetical protein
MPLTSYAEVQQFITNALKANGSYGLTADAKCLHHNFWETMSYNDFTTGNIPGGITDNNGNPIRILIPGNSAGSALTQALLGTGIADPNTGAVNQMPDATTKFTAQQINEIAAWIDANCPL